MNVYKYIRANNGWDNWDMVEIERFEAIDGYDAKKKERYWIEELKATLNNNIPTRTIKEYEEDNKEKILEKKREYQKEHYKNNKEKVKEYHKEHYKNNKETIAEKGKEYQKKNKEIINEKRKEKVQCECGCEIRNDFLSKHRKSKKHIELMSQYN
jgi:hypothetical protein